MSAIRPFPTDWQSALVLVPHPDDPEYGLSAAVAKWTAADRTVRYELACRGEAGIEGMAPEQAGPIRAEEQRRSAAIVGVDHVEFWDFPDSKIRNTAALRDRIAARITALRPDVVFSIYGGGEWGPGMPNQRDHVEFAAAVTEAFDQLTDPPRWLFQFGPEPTHIETVDDYLEAAVDALAAHKKYLSVLDPDTPVREQAAAVIEMTVGTAPQTGARVVGFIRLRGPA